MKTVLAKAGACIGLLALSITVHAATFYVSPAGDDEAAGTSASTAWRTIGAANKRISAGDTVLIGGGEYQGDPIDPARSGREDAYITYAALEGERPVLTGALIAVILDGRSYVRIRGIEVDGQRPWKRAGVESWVAIRGGSHNVIEDSRFRYAKGWYGIVLEGDTHHNVIRGNEFDFVGAWRGDSSKDSDKGDVMGLKSGTNRNLIEGNVFTHGGHNLMYVAGSYNVIRNNVFDNDWSDVEGAGKGNRNLSIAGGRYNVFEDNVVRNAGAASDHAAPQAMKVEGRNQIVRRNFIVDNVHEAISTSARSSQPHASGNRIYHNTIVGNGGPAWRVTLFDSSLKIDDNVFINNLVADNRRNPASGDEDFDILWEFQRSGYGLGSNRVVNNLIVSSRGDAYHRLDGFVSAISSRDAEGDYPQNFEATIERTPEFGAAAAAGDRGKAMMEGYALKPGSPGVDEGAFLTVTVSDGSGSSVEVADAGFFSDGATIAAPDVITIGDDRNLRVLEVDYERGTLVVDKSISWQAGEGVSLRYFGSAPDVGAAESIPNGANRPMPPQVF